MKITSFNPLIVTKDSETVIKLFEDLGFERRHTKTGINDEDIRCLAQFTNNMLIFNKTRYLMEHTGLEPIIQTLAAYDTRNFADEGRISPEERWIYGRLRTERQSSYNNRCK